MPDINDVIAIEIIQSELAVRDYLRFSQNYSIWWKLKNCKNEVKPLTIEEGELFCEEYRILMFKVTSYVVVTKIKENGTIHFLVNPGSIFEHSRKIIVRRFENTTIVEINIAFELHGIKLLFDVFYRPLLLFYRARVLKQLNMLKIILNTS